MVKTVSIVAIVIATGLVFGDRISAQAKQLDIFLNEKKEEMTAVQAARALIHDKNVRIYRCSEIELTEKLTLRKKKNK